MNINNLNNEISASEINRLKNVLRELIIREPNESQLDVINVSILKRMIIQWLKLDDFIRDKNKEIKNVKEEKTQIEDKILLFMESTEQDEIIAKDDKLKRKKIETKEKINEEYMKKTLLLALPGNLEMVDKLTNVLVNNRAITESYKLTRITTNK